MQRKKELVCRQVQSLYEKSGKPSFSFTTSELAQLLDMQRSNVSSILNELVQEEKLEKSGTRPVLYTYYGPEPRYEKYFSSLPGSRSFLVPVFDALFSALLYAKQVIPVVLHGQSGLEYDEFTKCIRDFLVAWNRLSVQDEQIELDLRYLHHPDEQIQRQIELLDPDTRHFFYIKNIQCLSETGMKRLKTLLDRKNCICVIQVDEEEHPDRMAKYLNQMPVVVPFPPLKERSLEEKQTWIIRQFQKEAHIIKKPIAVDPVIMSALLMYPWPENLIELHYEIMLATARANAVSLEPTLTLRLYHFSRNISMRTPEDLVETGQPDFLDQLYSLIYWHHMEIDETSCSTIKTPVYTGAARLEACYTLLQENRIAQSAFPAWLEFLL